MNDDGTNVTQITFDNSYVLEHVAVSHDRTKIIANYFSDLTLVGQSSKLILFDIPEKTMVHLLPEFTMAGNGGVDWDVDGYIYFAAVAQLPFPNPGSLEEHKVNAAANDIYRMKFDGTDLQNLTNTKDRGEADVSVSPDGQFISYMATNLKNVPSTFTEIWKRNADGANPKLVYTGGEDRISSVHDPEISPDGRYVVFSRVNNDVAPVFPDNPLANTAHDIITADLSNSGSESVITLPGPISITPDWSEDKILYLEITDKTTPPHAGLALINSDGTGYRLIHNGANIGKWIPD